MILMQMGVGGFSLYTLSAIRAYVTNESWFSKGQHEAVYFLNLYLETSNPRYLARYQKAIQIPLAYRRARQLLDRPHPDVPAVGRALADAGSSAKDIPSLIWMFGTFRGFPYLEEAIAKWQEADKYILEIDRLAKAIDPNNPTADVVTLRDRLEDIDAAITPRAIAFSRALNGGARVVETLLMVVNLALAGILVALTVWRVGRFLHQRREIESRLSWQASHDELTGLVNRRGFEARLSARSMALEDRVTHPCALMLIDLDQFKVVNDTCGHAAGDVLLKTLCPRLQRALGPDDVLARLGGDEFGVFLPTAALPRALAIAERLRSVVEEVDFAWNDRIFGVTASIGLVHEETNKASPEDMMRAADMACFMAKDKGRNRVHVHREGDEETLDRVREMNWVQRIHQALNENRFCLYAQEIVPLSNVGSHGTHVEMLIRMREVDGTLVPPSSFLPAAERFGLVKLIDRWVVRESFRALAVRRGLDRASPIARCGINLSGATVGDSEFLGFLRERFAEFGIAPDAICFEVTETAAIVNLEAARFFIADLKALGCTFALDDFGSGMSSFSYLKALPVDFLKIDGRFVKNLMNDRADRAMVEMISHVGHVMGKRIVAEFVETKALAVALREIGVDYGQGYGLAPPRPFDANFDRVPTDASFGPILPKRLSA